MENHLTKKTTYTPSPGERERLQSAMRLLAHNIIRFGTFDQHMELFETLVRLNKTLQPVFVVDASRMNTDDFKI